MMRVAILCPYSLSVFGGVQLQVLSLARALRDLGVDARVLGPTDGPPPEPSITSLGPTLGYPTNGSIAPIASSKAVAARTLEALRAFGPDVLHLHEPFMPGGNHAALFGTDIPSVGTFHAAHPGRNGWYEAFRLPLRKMVDRLAVRTAVSEEAQRVVERMLGGSCEILPNGVEVATFAGAVPWPAPRPAVFFVGRHEPRKGLGVLLDAWAGLERDAVLWIAGDGPQTDALRAQALDLGVAGVEWLGRISDVEKAQRLRGATLACFPSIESESFGIVLLEAMAAGTAVVASDLAGYRNVARAGQEATLVAPGDPDALRNALRAMLDDAGRRADQAAAGEVRAAEFTMTGLATSFLDRYVRARKPMMGVAS